MPRGDHFKGAAKSNKHNYHYVDDATQRITDLSEQLAAEKQVSAELFSFTLSTLDLFNFRLLGSSQ
jgi:hypothetical protein